MSTRAATSRPSAPEIRAYWERRAQRYAGDGKGLKAVCSFGMPAFYNRAIDLVQERALTPWLDRVKPGSKGLDLGCGVGRWSQQLAARGVRMTGVDLSSAMVEQATLRAQSAGVSDLCTFIQGDLPSLDLGRRFDVVVCVTVLQHIVDPERRAQAIRGIADHLCPSGFAVLLEAAPSRPWTASNHSQFRAAMASEFVEAFESAGLEMTHMLGVDAPLPRKYILPAYGRAPRFIGVPLLALGTAVTLPWELLAAARFPDASWHKLFVLRHADPAR